MRLIGCEPAGHGVETGEHAATLTAGEPGILHGSRSYVLQDEEGQITEPYSISAGLDYPGIGPEHAYLKDSGRGEYRAVTDDAAMQALRLLSRTEGIIPAIESAHALAGALEVGRELGPDGLIVVNLSGRGDKDMDTAARYFGLYDTDAEVAADDADTAEIEGDAEVSGNIQLLRETLAAAKAEDRAALIAYLPAGFPTVDGGIDAIKAVFDGGADVVEVGLPHSDPVLDGPVIQTADDIALRGGVRIADVHADGPGGPRGHRQARPRHDVLEPDRPLRRRALHRRARRGGRRRLHPARPAGRRSRRCGGSTPRSTASPPSSWSRPAARTRGSPRSPRPAAASSTRPR